MVDERVPSGLQKGILLILEKMAKTMDEQPKMLDQISFIQQMRVLQHQMRQMPVSRYIQSVFKTPGMARKPPGRESGLNQRKKAG